MRDAWLTGRVASRGLRAGALVLGAVLSVTACSDGSGEERGTSGPSTATAPSDSGTPSSPNSTPSASSTPSNSPRAPARPGRVRVGLATRTVQQLAGRIGPRMATGPAYRRAARWVAGELRGLGYRLGRQRFPVPAGTSWGVLVPAGTSVNLVATAPGVDRTEPHLVVGAHLDTVPQAPGAEDNASGVGTLLAVADAIAGRRTRLPVVLVVFGAEEPRGPTDDDHHYGSRHYVAGLRPPQRRALRGMLSLDRVGVGHRLPVCSANEPGRHRARVLAAARDARVPVNPCTGNRSSDHWSFVRDGLPGVRLGSTPYAGYHSAGDVPSVVDAAQLRRAARTTVAWLAPVR